MFQPLATPSPFCYIYFFFYNEIYACKLVTNCHEVTLSLFSGDRNFPSAVASPIMTCVVAPVTELSAHTLHPHPARVYRFFGSKNRDLQRYQQIIFHAFFVLQLTKCSSQVNGSYCLLHQSFVKEHSDDQCYCQYSTFY